MNNLKREKIDLLFIGLPHAINNESADPKEFPIEDQWAGAHPDDFQLLFSNSLSRIYKVLARSEYWTLTTVSFRKRNSFNDCPPFLRL